MWKINRISKETLLNISKFTNKIIKISKFLQEANQPFLMNELLNLSDQTDQVELLNAFDKDINKTVNDLYDIQKLLITVDENDNVKELKQSEKNLVNIFGENYSSKNKTLKIPNIKLDLRNPIEKKKIKSVLIENILNINIENYKNLLKIKDKIKDIKKENLNTEADKINYLVNKSDIDFVKDNVKKITTYIKSFVKIRKNLDIEEKELIDRKITNGRTMINGVVQDSTYIDLKENIIKISSTHQNDFEKIEKIIAEIKKEIHDSEYIKLVEIDKDTDLEKFLFLLKKIKNLHLNIDTEFEFKTRKLGNYRANGIYFQNEILTEQLGYHNLEYNIIALDVNSPSSLIHELTHLVDLSNEKNLKSEERLAMISHFSKKINKIELQMEGYTENYTDAICSPKEIIARLGEIGYILNKYDYNGHNNKEDLENFFKKVELLEGLEYKGEKEIPIVHGINFYRKNKNLFFNIETMIEEELLILKEYYSSYYNVERKNFIELKDSSIMRTLEKLNQLELNKENEYENDENKLKSTKRKYSQEDFPISKINKENINNIIEYNQKEKILTNRELFQILTKDFVNIDRKKITLSVEDINKKIEVFEKAFEFSIKTKDKDLMQSILDSIILKTNDLNGTELEKLEDKDYDNYKKESEIIGTNTDKKLRILFKNSMYKMLKSMTNKSEEDLSLKSNLRLELEVDRELFENQIKNRLNIIKDMENQEFVKITMLEITKMFKSYSEHFIKILNYNNEMNNLKIYENKNSKELGLDLEEFDILIEAHNTKNLNKQLNNLLTETRRNISYSKNGHTKYRLDFKMEHLEDSFLLNNYDEIVGNLVNYENKERNDKQKINYLKKQSFHNLNLETITNLFNKIQINDIKSEKLKLMTENSTKNYSSYYENLEKTKIISRYLSNKNILDDKNILEEILKEYTNQKMYSNDKDIFEKSKKKIIEAKAIILTEDKKISEEYLKNREEAVKILKKESKNILEELVSKNLLTNFINAAQKQKNENRRYLKVDLLTQFEGILAMNGISLEDSKIINKIEKQKNKKIRKII